MSTNTPARERKEHRRARERRRRAARRLSAPLHCPGRPGGCPRPVPESRRPARRPAACAVSKRPRNDAAVLLQPGACVRACRHCRVRAGCVPGECRVHACDRDASGLHRRVEREGEAEREAEREREGERLRERERERERESERENICRTSRSWGRSSRSFWSSSPSAVSTRSPGARRQTFVQRSAP